MAPSETGGVQIVRSESMAYDEALRASGVVHDEAMQAALDTAEAEQSRAERLQAATVARAENDPARGDKEECCY